MSISCEQESIGKVLDYIKEQAGVIGSLIVSRQGQVVAHNLPAGADADSLATYALGIQENTAKVASGLRQGMFHQMLATTTQGYLIIDVMPTAIVVTVTGPMAVDTLIPIISLTTRMTTKLGNYIEPYDLPASPST